MIVDARARPGSMAAGTDMIHHEQPLATGL
jgi:hypothetical protein